MATGTKKLYVQIVKDTCSKCPNLDYQWNMKGEDGKSICLATQAPPLQVFEGITLVQVSGYHNGYRVIEYDKTEQYNPKCWIPDWCPLPDAKRK